MKVLVLVVAVFVTVNVSLIRYFRIEYYEQLFFKIKKKNVRIFKKHNFHLKFNFRLKQKNKKKKSSNMSRFVQKKLEFQRMRARTWSIKSLMTAKNHINALLSAS